MRKAFAVLVLCLTSLPVSAQQVYVGAAGGSSFGNLFASAPIVLARFPVGNRLELESREEFSPLEEHIKLGSGFANTAGVGPTFWLSRHFGAEGYIESSLYHVTKLTKSDGYWFAGLALRTEEDRFTFSFMHELRHGIDRRGVEADNVIGGDFRWDFELGYAHHLSWHGLFETNFGHLQEQGNPDCDGTFSHVVTCKRLTAWSGGATAGILIGLIRHETKH